DHRRRPPGRPLPDPGGRPAGAARPDRAHRLGRRAARPVHRRRAGGVRAGRVRRRARAAGARRGRGAHHRAGPAHHRARPAGRRAHGAGEVGRPRAVGVRGARAVRRDRGARRRRAARRPGASGPRLGRARAPEPDQLQARLRRRRVRLALRLRDLARRGRDAGSARPQRLDRADRELRGQRQPDDHTGVAPYLRRMRRRDTGGPLPGVAARAGGRHTRPGEPHDAGRPARHRAAHRTRGQRRVLRLQLHARLGRQHHAPPAIEPVRRVQQRGERAGGAVRRARPAPTPHRRADGAAGL
ncbi:MAG: Ectoine hydroxylase, partial [uncultured Pseudonocardia sp.]